MNLQRWISRRQASWKELDKVLKRAEQKGVKSLDADEIRQMASLYRSVSADLARAKTTGASELITHDLQTLTARGYSQIYQGARRREWRSVWEFFRWGFPAAVQRSRGYIALATGLFAIAGLIAWWLAWRDPAFLEVVAPPHLLETVRERGELWMGSIVGIEPYASSSIMVNNIQVSFAALAGGIFAGLGTVYIMLFNGILIGAIAALVAQNNLAFPFWAFVFPHGSLELPAIFLAGGAGLLLARALLFPGRYRRDDALKVYGLQAAQLVFGIVPMLVIAGIIEGFFSPQPVIPDPVKYLVGTILFIALMNYLGTRRQVE
jgi:uncharacterized membrane protein SpoIIM required for sporulation